LPCRTLRHGSRLKTIVGHYTSYCCYLLVIYFVVTVVVVALFDSTPFDAFLFLDSTRRVVLDVVVVCVLVIQQLRKDTLTVLSSLLSSSRVRHLKRRLDLDFTRRRLSSSSS
jgi:hypothetical protein